MQRSDIRLLSSLRDLRLGSKCEMVITEERKRKDKRLCPIKARPQDNVIYENFQIVKRKKNVMDISFIAKSLGHHFTFSTLIADKALQDQLIDQFRLCRVEQGSYLMKQNDNASSFFILQEGELQVEVNGVAGGKISHGQGFGELALLYSTPRSASILAKKKSLLWFIDRTTFRNVVSNIIEKSFAENKKFVYQNKFFAYLTDRQKDSIASIAITQCYTAGAKICRQGEAASAMFIIKKGKLNRTLNGLIIGSYESGDSLEEYATLTKGSTRKQTIVASEPTEVIAFGVDEIERALGKSLPLIILRNNVKSVLVEDPFFKDLSKEFKEKVIDCLQIEKVQAKQLVFTKGDYCKNKILFIIEGEYQLTSKKAARLPLYGSHCIAEGKRDQAYPYSCEMLTQGRIAITSLAEIEEGLGMKVEEAIKKSLSIKKIHQGRQSLVLEMKNLSKNFELKDFSVVKKLGEGQFGQVFLVVHNASKKLYALKCISKAQTIKYSLEKHLINEKSVLESHCSPFIVQFIRSFQDQHFVYFLTEFIQGLELFDALRAIGLVPLKTAQFFVANIILAIESLHSKGIVYRDLKPENVMVMINGYLKIIDMGTCKNMNSSISQKTFTIIGTPNYMAPQILSGKGYGYAVDLWSLGVMLFQFLSGYLPFGENCEDPYEIYEEIIQNELKFPKYMKDLSANSLITRLLARTAESRLGDSYGNLKSHDFFKQIQWHLIEDKTFNPPFKPSKECAFKGSIPSSSRPIENYLKVSPTATSKRPDLNPHWDSCF